MLVFKLAALVEMSLFILKSCGFFPTRLPLGGDHMKQLGIVFASAYVIAEFISVLAGPWTL
jgi:hypothetical protein